MENHYWERQPSPGSAESLGWGTPSYGNLTNLIKMKRVYMVEHSEGVGTEESPHRTVRTFFDEEGNFLGRGDPFMDNSR